MATSDFDPDVAARLMSSEQKYQMLLKAGDDWATEEGFDRAPYVDMVEKFVETEKTLDKLSDRGRELCDQYQKGGALDRLPKTEAEQEIYRERLMLVYQSRALMMRLKFYAGMICRRPMPGVRGFVGRLIGGGYLPPLAGSMRVGDFEKPSGVVPPPPSGGRMGEIIVSPPMTDKDKAAFERSMETEFNREAPQPPASHARGNVFETFWKDTR